ncbi:ogr/Delta-like zinc finger family protein [Chelonobacter oris]|uniref:ogr/Delta-like zinc finger family protein n=1 Tax=Chelonobacter oris TaxID=505317 RepID=UPI0024494BD3|nr:ogr/Delta-like zinc finger family protein [Chelonobacter oris]
MGRTLDIFCNVCGSKARINRTVRGHSDFNELYCTCNNPECRHKFVMSLEFSRTTTASLLIKNAILSHLISCLSEDEKQEIIRALKTSK